MKPQRIDWRSLSPVSSLIGKVFWVKVRFALRLEVMVFMGHVEIDGRWVGVCGIRVAREFAIEMIRGLIKISGDVFFWKVNLI